MQRNKVINMQDFIDHKKAATPLELQLTASLLAAKNGITKNGIAQLADTAVEQVLEEGNVFEAAEALAGLDEFAKTVRKDERYIQFLRDELAKHQGRMVTKGGAKIELCEAAVSYDYSSNPEWTAVDEEIKRLQEAKKIIEEKLKAIAPGRVGVDLETGEIIEGAYKTSKSTYRITLAK